MSSLIEDINSVTKSSITLPILSHSHVVMASMI